MKAKTGLAWLFYKSAKEAFNNKDWLKSKSEINRYIKLNNTDLPSNLNSNFLILALRMKRELKKEFKFGIFLLLWKTKNFSPADWEKKEDYDSTAVQAIYAACKEAYDEAKKAENPPSPESIAFFTNELLPLVAREMPACKYGEWFPLYECRIHLWLGDTDLAFKEALEIVRKKSSEFWAWSLLAVILIAQGKHDDAFTCLVKSATCPGEEKFRFSVRFDLARRLVERKMYPEAKFEADRGREGIEFYGHDVPDDIAALEGIPEYAAAPTLKDNKALYRKYLSSANELLLGNLPWFEAILGNKFTKKKTPEDKNRKAFLQYLHKKCNRQSAVLLSLCSCIERLD